MTTNFNIFKSQNKVHIKMLFQVSFFSHSSFSGSHQTLLILLFVSSVLSSWVYRSPSNLIPRSLLQQLYTLLSSHCHLFCHLIMYCLVSLFNHFIGTYLIILTKCNLLKSSCFFFNQPQNLTTVLSTNSEALNNSQPIYQVFNNLKICCVFCFSL